MLHAAFINRRTWQVTFAGMQLTRPANVVTAWADILAGAAVAFGRNGTDAALAAIPWLLLATTGLYAGGVVLNDVIDAELDGRERPERPIPSGRISRGAALFLAVVLLLAGAVFAARVSFLSLLVACMTLLAILSYNSLTKSHSLLGPANMGLCRAGNLLLGLSVQPGMFGTCWPISLIPVLYIGAITSVSQGEVHGGDHQRGGYALLLIGLVMLAVLATGIGVGHQWAVFCILALFGWRVLPAFLAAARCPDAALIRRAVKVGVLSLVLLDAAVAAGLAGFLYASVVLLLWPLSHILARTFAVT